jgi:hypothetical protein
MYFLDWMWNLKSVPHNHNLLPKLSISICGMPPSAKTKEKLAGGGTASTTHRWLSLTKNRTFVKGRVPSEGHTCRMIDIHHSTTYTIPPSIETLSWSHFRLHCHLYLFVCGLFFYLVISQGINWYPLYKRLKNGKRHETINHGGMNPKSSENRREMENSNSTSGRHNITKEY